MSGVLFDLEGTLFAAGRIIEGAPEALAEVRRRGLGVRFLTNIESRPPEQIAVELSCLGLEITEADLFTPITAAHAVISDRPGARVLPLLGPDLASSLDGVVREGPYTQVLVGDVRDVLDYQLLDKAFRAVRAGAELLALQVGPYFKREDGDHLDTGAIVAALEFATGVRARVLGKPSLDFFTLAAADLGIDLTECVVVGDDSTTDILGGATAGARTVQVRTGKFVDQAAHGDLYPADVTIDSVAGLPGVLDKFAALDG